MSATTASGTGAGSKSLTLTAMIFAVAMTFIDQTIVSIAAPTIQNDLGLSASGMQWAINAYLLTLAALFAWCSAWCRGSPGAADSAGPLLWLSGIALVLGVVGLAGLRRRDIGDLGPTGLAGPVRDWLASYVRESKELAEQAAAPGAAELPTQAGPPVPPAPPATPG